MQHAVAKNASANRTRTTEVSSNTHTKTIPTNITRIIRKMTTTTKKKLTMCHKLLKCLKKKYSNYFLFGIEDLT